MPTNVTEIQEVLVNYTCDYCDSEDDLDMIHMRLHEGRKMKYIYRCNACGELHYLDDVYPRVEKSLT